MFLVGLMNLILRRCNMCKHDKLPDEIIVKDKKVEFSKVIAVIAIVMWVVVNIYGMVMMAITLDLSPLMYIVGSVDAVVAIVYTTYSIKAKAENMIKLKRIYGYDAESVVDAVLRKENYYDED